MDPLSITASVIAVTQITSTIIGYLNDVKDAPKDRARCAIEASNFYNLLINLRYRLEEATVNDPWYTGLRALAVENGPLDQYKVLLERLQSKIASKSGLEKLSTAVTWKFIKEDVAVIFSTLERLKTLVHVALDMDHFKLSIAIKDYSQNIDNSTQAIKSDTTSLRECQDEQKHNATLNWLSSSDLPAQQSDFIGRRQEHTGLWFINSTKFQEWFQGTSQTLFCPGIPGAGKTMITAIVVDYLWNHASQNDVGIAYLYCNYKRQSSQTTTDLLAAILRQIAQGQVSIDDAVGQLYGKHAGRGTRPSLDEIYATLKSVLSKNSKNYIVVDALDECADSEELLSRLRGLQDVADTRLMVTTRPIPKIIQGFAGDPTLEIRASDSDITVFVSGHIDRLPRFVQRDSELQIRIRDAIISATDGMFLLAFLHLDSLRGKVSKKALQSSLESLPKGSKGLDKAYDEALERIEGQLPDESALAKRVLTWIVYALRPLKTFELANALAVEPDELELDEDNLPEVEDMVSVCGGLVTVDEMTGIIRLVHYTTQEYFERIREVWIPDAQVEIASTCLTYLSFKTFVDVPNFNYRVIFEGQTDNPFLKYAAQYWGIHAFTVQERIHDQALKFLRDVSLVSNAFQMMEDKGRSWRFTIPGIHLAARFGLAHFLNTMIKEDITVSGSPEEDLLDSNYQSPLSWAAEYGHKDAVALLLDTGNVDVNRKDIDRETPFSRAVLSGKAEVAKLFLATGKVDLNLAGRTGDMLLSSAAEAGEESMVKLLLDTGSIININFKNDEGETALSLAAAEGHENVVELLLATDGVEINSKDMYGEAPLSYAAARGHEGVVKLLLATKEVNVNCSDDGGRTPLLWAVSGGHKGVVELLLATGEVDVALKDLAGRTPQSIAEERGHDSIVELLQASTISSENSE